MGSENETFKNVPIEQKQMLAMGLKNEWEKKEDMLRMEDEEGIT